MGITSKTTAPMPKKGQTYLRQYELVDIVRAYDPSVDEALLNNRGCWNPGWLTSRCC